MKEQGRFFARILGVELACPDCGYVHTIKFFAPVKVGSKSKVAANTYWDPLTSRFRCKNCLRVWMLGVLAWKPKRGLPTVPIDQSPNRAEAKMLRETRWLNSQGIVMQGTLNWSKGHANLVNREGCECADGTCKVHVK